MAYSSARPARPARLDPYDLSVPPDEELPGYEPASLSSIGAAAPSYAEADYETPLHVYHLQQVDRKLQLWVPLGVHASTYKIIARPSLRVFTKKQPDLAMTRVSASMSEEASAGNMNFDNNGPLPWRPRAHVVHADDVGTLTSYAMESRNFTDWTVDFSGVTLAWRLEGRPVSLVLSELTAPLVIARFTYSGWGSGATNGATVGDLTIYRDALSMDRNGVEKIIGSLMVPLTHFKKMGRQYWNDAPARAQSLTREHLPSHRSSMTAHSVTGLYVA